MEYDTYKIFTDHLDQAKSIDEIVVIYFPEKFKDLSNDAILAF